MHWFERYFRFLMIGGCMTALHLGFLFLFVEIGFLTPLPANALAFSIVVVISYFLQAKLTFESEGNHGYFMPRYVGVAILGLGINQSVMILMMSLGLMYMIAATISAFTASVVSFLIHRFWVFRPGAE